MIKIKEGFWKMKESVMNICDVDILSDIIIRIYGGIYEKHLRIILSFFHIFPLIEKDRHTDIPTGVDEEEGLY